MNELRKLDSAISQTELMGLRTAPLKPIENIKLSEDENLAQAVEDGIPQFTHVDRGPITGEYGIKDGILYFHLYKKDRKERYDQIMQQVAATKRGSKEEAAAFNEGDQKMREIPWWSDTEEVLNTVAKEQYKYIEAKIVYAPEVDSWTVMLPEPTSPGATSRGYLEKFFNEIALRIGAK